MQDLCTLMGVSRSGYYKWKRRERSERDVKREEMIALVAKVHEKHPSHGYRWVAAYIRINLGYQFSDNYIYKAFRYLEIKAETKHQEKRRPRKEKDKYPNLIFSTWETVDRPRQVIVSDMTSFKFWIYYFEVTFYFDVFTKEILSYRVAERRGHRDQYIDGLKDVVELLRGNPEPTVIHTDQGSVYASKAYNELIQDTNIVRSMSRAGKPTDNPVNESLNGWIKEELYIDFKIDHCRERDEFKDIFANALMGLVGTDVLSGSLRDILIKTVSDVVDSFIRGKEYDGLFYKYGGNEYASLAFLGLGLIAKVDNNRIYTNTNSPMRTFAIPLEDENGKPKGQLADVVNLMGLVLKTDKPVHITNACALSCTDYVDYEPEIKPGDPVPNSKELFAKLVGTLES